MSKLSVLHSLSEHSILGAWQQLHMNGMEPDKAANLLETYQILVLSHHQKQLHHTTAINDLNLDWHVLPLDTMIHLGERIYHRDSML